MLTKLKLLKSNPKRYLPLACRYGLSLPQRVLSFLFSRSGFHLQEQMDIHRKSTWHDSAFAKETGGFFLAGDMVKRRVENLEPWDATRRDMLVLLMRSVLERGIAGDVAELGVYRGRTARLIHHYMPDRTLHLFDTFEGFSEGDVSSEKNRTGLIDSDAHYSDTCIELVLRTIDKQNDNIRIHKGVFPDSFPAALSDAQFALLHLDVDLYAPTMSALALFYDKIPAGGIIVVHDYNAWPGPRRAVDEFFKGKPEIPIPMPDKNGSAVITKIQSTVSS